MASIITHVVTSTVTANASSTSAATTKVPAQGGIIEGANPSKWNASNPITLFIIQVRVLDPGCLIPSLTLAATGWNHHHLLSGPTLPSLQNQTATSHCRDYWGNPTGSFGLWTDTRLYRCHIPNRLYARPEYCCQPRPDFVPILSRP